MGVIEDAARAKMAERLRKMAAVAEAELANGRILAYAEQFGYDHLALDEACKLLCTVQGRQIDELRGQLRKVM